MKIALIHNQYRRKGGMESYMFDLIAGFIKAGDEVNIYTYKTDETSILPNNCELIKSNYWFLPRRLRKYVFIHAMNKSFDKSKYDISISMTRTDCQSVAVIGGVHAAWIAINNDQKKNSWYDRLDLRHEQSMFDKVDWIMAHSKIIGQEICDHYSIDVRKLKVLYPPVDHYKFQRAPIQHINKFQAQYNMSDSQLNYLFPSMGHSRKGIYELIACFAKLDPAKYKLWLVGRPTKLSLPSNVRYLGYQADMSIAYSSVDYTILPSHYEPFGLVVPESLNCLTPVIVTKNVGAAELVAPNDGVILDNSDPETLRECILNLDKNNFNVTPNYVQTNHLTIDHHIEQIKALFCNVQTKREASCHA